MILPDSMASINTIFHHRSGPSDDVQRRTTQFHLPPSLPCIPLAFRGRYLVEEEWGSLVRAD